MRLDRDLVLDILEAIENIERYSQGGREAFDRDELIRVWFLRHLEIIGEAASRLSAQTRASAGSVPWRNIVGMRNILIHHYFAVDWNEVWNVIHREIPPLKNAMEKLLASLQKT